MTSRERWLAALRMEEVDRLPFWPKLSGSYPPAQAAPYSGMSLEEIHGYAGSDMHVGIGNCTRHVRRRTSVETERAEGERRTVFKAACGSTDQVEKWDDASQSWHPVKFPARDRETIRILTEVFADVEVEADGEAVEKASERKKELGEAASTHASLGESPLMLWVEWLAGVESGHYLLMDHREEVEELFAAIHRVNLLTTETASVHCPADMLYFIENTSTTLISPGQYREYCLKHITDYGNILRGACRTFVLHMCGTLKALLPMLAGVPADAFEAFTSPTLGDTTLLDGRTSCPDKCLIGGTNAMLWTRPAEEIIRGIEEALEPLPHHRGIVVTSAGVMPPLCRPETIKEVCEWVTRYPART